MRLTFLRATGLGDLAAEPGQTLEVEGPALVRDLIATGRAIPAPGEEAPAPQTALTTESFAPPEKAGNPTCKLVEDQQAEEAVPGVSEPEAEVVASALEREPEPEFEPEPESVQPSADPQTPASAATRRKR